MTYIQQLVIKSVRINKYTYLMFIAYICVYNKLYVIGNMCIICGLIDSKTL